MLLNRAAYELPIAECVYVPSIVAQLSTITAADIYTSYLEPALLETIKYPTASTSTSLSLDTPTTTNVAQQSKRCAKTSGVTIVPIAFAQVHLHAS
uniref:Uncharacterized protein n=1 Tax=Ascaris lumbricoides TaxID=6252 RepID=A0A0M3I3Q0_ASCLU